MALLSQRDQGHDEAERISRELFLQKRPRVLTEWVLVEFLGSTARPPSRDLAIQTVEQLRNSSLTEIIAADHASWEKGYELYKSRPDKSWSLVDCISITICHARGIKEVFTADKHFEQAGLQIMVQLSA
jgi:predicted nucleic acid-binding protein